MKDLITYIIHYTPLKVRKQFMLEQLDKHSLNYNFVEEYDKENLSADDLHIFNCNIIKLSMISNIRKHILVYNNILYNDYKYSLILEDDAILHDKFIDELAKGLKQLPDTYDMLFIGNCCGLHIPLFQRIPNRLIYLKSREPTSWGGDGATRCTDSYFVSKKCAQKLVDYISEFKEGSINIHTSALWLNHVIRELKLEIYWLEPTIVTQESNNFVFSSFSDNNILHIFAFDIIKYYNKNSVKAYIWSKNIDKNHCTQKWRYFVMNKLYDCKYVDVDIPNNVKERLKQSHDGYDCWKFIKYKEDPHIKNIYRKIISNVSDGQHILLNIRDDHRILYDNNSGLKLESFLQDNQNRLNASFIYCNFSNMPPDEQYKICNNAKILISVHGAGCTNLIFTPQNTPLIEINFRKDWYCDPVCNLHREGKISMNTKCDGKLTYKPYFHKADYHNLCYLLGKKYLEIEAIKYDGGFLSQNPISKKNIYIDGEKLIIAINELLI